MGIVTAVKNVLGYGDEAVSIGIEDISPSDSPAYSWRRNGSRLCRERSY
jgi:hypothetical protein